MNENITFLTISTLLLFNMTMPVFAAEEGHSSSSFNTIIGVICAIVAIVYIVARIRSHKDE